MRISTEKEYIDSVIKNSVRFMPFVLFISLAKFGMSVGNALFLVFLLGFIIIYRFQWRNLSDSRKGILVGISYMVNSITLVITGVVMADIQYLWVAILLISFYVIDILLVIYFIMKPPRKKDEITGYKAKLSTGILLMASTLGLGISRYMQRTLTDDLNILFAAYGLIVLSYLLAIGIKFIVLEVKSLRSN